MQGRLIEFGFEWGPMKVERGFCDDPKGWATLLLKTKKYPHGINIYVTKTGKVRVYCAKGEWKVGADSTAKTKRHNAQVVRREAAGVASERTEG